MDWKVNQFGLNMHVHESDIDLEQDLVYLQTYSL